MIMYIRYVIHILFLIEFDKTNQTNHLLVQNPCINVSLLPWHSYFYIHVLTVICTVTLWEWLYCTNPNVYFYICIKRMTFVWYLVIWSHETCFVFLNIILITHDQSSDTIARKIDAYKLLLMEYIYIYVLVKKNKPIQDTFFLVRYIFNKFDNKNTKNI